MKLENRPPCGTCSLRGSTTWHRSGGQPGGVQGSGLNVSAKGSPPTHPQRQIRGRHGENQFESCLVSSKISLTLQPSKVPCRHQHRCVLQARDGAWHWAGCLACRQGLHLRGSSWATPPSVSHQMGRDQGFCANDGGGRGVALASPSWANVHPLGSC